MDKTLSEFDRKLKSAKTAFHRKGDIIKNLSREVSELKELLRMSEENNQRWKHLFQLFREGQVSLDVADPALHHLNGEHTEPSWHQVQSKRFIFMNINII